MIKPWGIIYCPKEGTRRTERRWKKIRRYLDEQGASYDYVQSDGPGAVERLAAMMTRTGYRTIIVVGGDSALNHALCGIMNTESPTGRHPEVGVIPNGLGNDFAHYWGFRASDYKRTIDALIEHRTRKVDVGQADITRRDGTHETLYFLNCVNLGIASLITNLLRRLQSLFHLRTLTYLLSAFILLFQRMSWNMSLRMTGVDERLSAMGVCVGSAHSYGQTPSAVPYNGQLDVTVVQKPQVVQLFHGLWLLFTARFLTHRGVRVWRTQHIAFAHTGHAPLSIDGRVYHHPVEALDVTIHKEEITFLIP